MRRRVALAATTLVAMSLVAALGYVLHVAHDRRPGPDQVEMDLEIRFAEPENFSATLMSLGGHASRHAGIPTDTRALLIRIAWRATESFDGSYALIAMDKSRYPPRPLLANGAWLPDATVGSHRSSSYVALAQRYDWLAGLGLAPNADEKSYMPSALGWPAKDSGLAIGNWLIDRQTTLPINSSDLLVALVFVDPAGEPTWAKRVHG